MALSRQELQELFVGSGDMTQEEFDKKFERPAIDLNKDRESQGTPQPGIDIPVPLDLEGTMGQPGKYEKQQLPATPLPGAAGMMPDSPVVQEQIGETADIGTAEMIRAEKVKVKREASLKELREKAGLYEAFQSKPLLWEYMFDKTPEEIDEEIKNGQSIQGNVLQMMKDSYPEYAQSIFIDQEDGQIKMKTSEGIETLDAGFWDLFEESKAEMLGSLAGAFGGGYVAQRMGTDAVLRWIVTATQRNPGSKTAQLLYKYGKVGQYFLLGSIGSGVGAAIGADRDFVRQASELGVNITQAARLRRALGAGLDDFVLGSVTTPVAGAAAKLWSVTFGNLPTGLLKFAIEGSNPNDSAVVRQVYKRAGLDIDDPKVQAEILEEYEKTLGRKSPNVVTQPNRDELIDARGEIDLEKARALIQPRGTGKALAKQKESPSVFPANTPLTPKEKAKRALEYQRLAGELGDFYKNNKEHTMLRLKELDVELDKALKAGDEAEYNALRREKRLLQGAIYEPDPNVTGRAEVVGETLGGLRKAAGEVSRKIGLDRTPLALVGKGLDFVNWGIKNIWQGVTYQGDFNVALGIGIGKEGGAIPGFRLGMFNKPKHPNLPKGMAAALASKGPGAKTNPLLGAAVNWNAETRSNMLSFMKQTSDILRQRMAKDTASKAGIDILELRQLETVTKKAYETSKDMLTLALRNSVLSKEDLTLGRFTAGVTPELKRELAEIPGSFAAKFINSLPSSDALMTPARLMRLNESIIKQISKGKFKGLKQTTKFLSSLSMEIDKLFKEVSGDDFYKLLTENRQNLRRFDELRTNKLFKAINKPDLSPEDMNKILEKEFFIPDNDAMGDIIRKLPKGAKDDLTAFYVNRAIKRNGIRVPEGDIITDFRGAYDAVDGLPADNPRVQRLKAWAEAFGSGPSTLAGPAPKEQAGFFGNVSKPEGIGTSAIQRARVKIASATYRVMASVASQLAGGLSDSNVIAALSTYLKNPLNVEASQKVFGILRKIEKADKSGAQTSVQEQIRNVEDLEGQLKAYRSVFTDTKKTR